MSGGDPLSKLSKNSRIVFAYRLPVMHCMVAFCLIKQVQWLERKYSKEPVKPWYVEYIHKVSENDKMSTYSSEKSKRRTWRSC